MNSTIKEFISIQTRKHCCNLRRNTKNWVFNCAINCCKRYDIAKSLVEAGFVDFYTGTSAFKQVARDGDLDMLVYLDNKGFGIHTYTDALPQAAEYGHIEIIKYLVSKGANVNAQYCKPIINACVMGHIEVVKCLISLGANYKIYDYWPLHMAIMYEHLSLVKYLFSVDPKIPYNMKSIINYLPLNSKHFEIINYLCEKGFDKTLISNKCLSKYLSFCQKMKDKNRIKAQKIIYYWWIPICYDMNRECGKRMGRKNLKDFENMMK